MEKTRDRLLSGGTGGGGAGAAQAEIVPLHKIGRKGFSATDGVTAQNFGDPVKEAQECGYSGA